jgi:hypothetical protein
VRKARFHHRLPRRVLAHAGRQHLAHDDFSNEVGRQAGALGDRLDDGRTELGRGDFGQAAAEFADGGAGR